MASNAIFGREEELAAITRFILDDRPHACALLLEGDPGIGKTTLWREGVRLAESKGLALTARASEAETNLSFTVLGDLLAPVLDGALVNLVPARRRALEAALLLGPPSPTDADPRAVSLAVFEVLMSLAADRPLTIAIDDMQWTDAPSARVLTFALRRLAVEPVSIFASRRIAGGLSDPLELGTAFPRDVEHLVVGPIARETMGRLLRNRLGRVFAAPLLRRIHDASGGNPFFALEIGQALARDEPALPPDEPVPIPQDLQELLRKRLSTLSGPTRHALLLAASSAQPTRALVEAAGGERSGLEEAEEAEIVTVRREAIDFTHPLLASTVYASASSRARKEAHAHLARIATAPEERARHLALSIDGPDEDVAMALERAALQAQARGAPSAAAELNLLAAAATPSESTELVWTRRSLSVGNLYAAGDVVGARALSEVMLTTAGSGSQRANTLSIIAATRWNDVGVVKRLLSEALEVVGDDHALEAEIQAELAWAALWSVDPATAITWADSALEWTEKTEALDLTRPYSRWRRTIRSALSVRGMATSVLGDDGTDLLERGISLEGELDNAELTTPRICHARVQVWEGGLDAARATLEAELERWLEQGRDGLTWEVRVELSDVEFRAGHWALALQHASDALEIAMDGGWSDVLGQILPTKASIEVAVGDTQAGRESAMQALRLCERIDDRWDEIRARSTLGFLELSLGDHAACHAWLEPVTALTEEMGVREPGVFPFIPDEIEALVALGDLDEATRLAVRLEEQGAALARPLALATAARCQGLISGASRDVAGAEEHLRRALDLHRSIPQPFELGRTLLVQGDVARRAKRKRDARTALAEALQIFEQLGAKPFADRARAQLERAGARAVGPTALTPTEHRVAELAAAGKTNRLIADELFVSVKTVEANMSRVLHKLGLHSRKDLPEVLDRDVDESP